MAWRRIASSPLSRSFLPPPSSQLFFSPSFSSLSPSVFPSTTLSSPSPLSSPLSSLPRRWISDDGRKDKEALEKKINELKQEMKEQKIKTENFEQEISNFGNAEHIPKEPFKPKSTLETLQELLKEDDFLAFWCFYFAMVIFYAHSCRIALRGEEEEEHQKQIVEKQKQLFRLYLLKNNYPTVLVECLEANLKDYERDVKIDTDVARTREHYTYRIMKQTEKKMSSILEQQNSQFLLDFFSVSPTEEPSSDSSYESSSDSSSGLPPPAQPPSGEQAIRF